MFDFRTFFTAIPRTSTYTNNLSSVIKVNSIVMYICACDKIKPKYQLYYLYNIYPVLDKFLYTKSDRSRL